MTTYVYETIPKIPGVEPRRFELRQSMKDAPITVDPQTGEPVRRVITGGYGLIAQKSSSTPVATTAARCAPGCACHRN